MGLNKGKKSYLKFYFNFNSNYKDILFSEKYLFSHIFYK